MRSALSAAVALAMLATACAHAPPAPPASLVGADGARQSLGDVVQRAPWTVLVFVSDACPCMAAHRDRLEELAAAYGPRQVQFLAVESEVGRTAEQLASEARDYSVPLVRDEGARLANALGAEYATYTVILDRTGQTRYRGGIDSDKLTIHPEATLFVRDALDDLLAGRPPRVAEGKTLGCMLRKW